MFESIKFGFRAGMTAVYITAAIKAQEAGNSQKTMLLLKKGIQAGNNALSIQSPKVSEKRRTLLRAVISSARQLYQQALFEYMPEADRALLTSVIKWWVDGDHFKLGVDPVDQMIDMFDIAQSRLNKDKEVLGMIYDGEHVPPPLRTVIKSFLTGEATEEETKIRLQACTEKLRKWLLEFFAADPLTAL